MSIKEQFINDLIRELNNINERRIYDNIQPLDVCYMISALDQHIGECTEFMNDITEHTYYINGYEEEDYSNGRIRVFIEKSDEEKESDMMVDVYYNYFYYITFTYDERMWGYCQCEPGDEGYNEDHKCCGCGCDWTAPSFEINKMTYIGSGKWDGYERDFWEYEKEFNKNKENKNEEVEEYIRVQEKESLEFQIKELQKKLEKLN